jgi:hypothetical protein
MKQFPSLFGFVIRVGLVISWLMFNGVKSPVALRCGYCADACGISSDILEARVAFA